MKFQIVVKNTNQISKDAFNHSAKAQNMSLRLLDLGIQKNSSLNGPVECGITTLLVRMTMKIMIMLLIMMMTLIAFQIL